MKKILSIILAISMIFTLSATSFAATITEESDPKTVDTLVIYTFDDEGYTVTIPDTIVANTSDPTAYTISASDVYIKATENLKVTLKEHDATVDNTDDATVKLAYDLKLGENVLANNDEILSVAPGALTGTSANITALITGTPTVIGTYTDTATFEVAIVPAA